RRARCVDGAHDIDPKHILRAFGAAFFHRLPDKAAGHIHQPVDVSVISYLFENPGHALLAGEIDPVAERNAGRSLACEVDTYPLQLRSDGAVHARPSEKGRCTCNDYSPYVGM